MVANKKIEKIKFQNITEMHTFIKKNHLEKKVKDVDSWSAPNEVILTYYTEQQ